MLRSRRLHRLANAPRRGYKGITAFLSTHFRVKSARKEDKQHPRLFHVRTDPEELPRRRRTSSASREGLQDRDRDTDEGRIGIGAQMIGVAGALDTRSLHKNGSSSARRCGVPGVSFQIAEAERSWKRPASCLQRRAASKMRSGPSSRGAMANSSIRVARKVSRWRPAFRRQRLHKEFSVEKFWAIRKSVRSTRDVNMQLATIAKSIITGRL